MNNRPIRTAIIDDEPAARRGLRLLLDEDPEIEIIGEAGDHDEALSLINEARPDLVFLDIQMPGGTGLSVAASIDYAPKPVILFATAYDDYALKAFEVHAIDYLLKPYDDDRFREALVHAKEQVRARESGGASNAKLELLIEQLQHERLHSQTEADRIVIKSSGELLILRTDEVDWVEADGDYMKFHVAGKAHLMRETMARLESRLDPKKFVRIHRSMIVNIDRVKKLSPVFGGEYSVILRDGTSLKLSRGYQDRFSELLKQSI